MFYISSRSKSLEKRGIKPELVNSLRQKLVNEPELFIPQRIKETEEFIKNNPNLVLKAPKKEPLPQDEFYLNRANKYIDELEQRGLKPEYVAKLRNNALENPHRFSDEAIKKMNGLWKITMTRFLINKAKTQIWKVTL